jgi:hypothetical protein
MISFTLRPNYPQEKSHWRLLRVSLGGHGGEEKILPQPGIEFGLNQSLL